ncbi:response regulator transcription factor [Kibdelosporangium philippinense]|uniref:Response regulator transcription factor n=1 Tax=Kibdelosporangium philippinense TaxID=211113 RepID=A0ABS8ZIP5_9PSEU|nr:response regulator transcription factor [Kibdelosporangium philippinense]MCE7006506.1 response regulator transcription factor [Kibdelosporangium philippinense]
MNRKAVPRLLIVADDEELISRLGELLDGAGYAHDVDPSMARALDSYYDVVLVDRGTDNLETLAAMRRKAMTARALVLSTIGSDKDQADAMAAGADDYLTTPFLPARLLGKIRGLLRRHIDNAETIPFGRAQLDVRKYEVVLPRGKRVSLSVREFDLLRTLVARPTVIYPKAELRTRVFGTDASESTVDTYVYYLRKKLGQGVVRSVYRLGYKAGAIAP